MGNVGSKSVWWYRLEAYTTKLFSTWMEEGWHRLEAYTTDLVGNVGGIGFQPAYHPLFPARAGMIWVVWASSLYHHRV